MTNTLEKRTRKHRAVAPVIATLLMVAIAVVGGTIIFVFSQGFFSNSQISGTPQIESYVVVYVKNDSVGQILFSEIRLGGTVYNYLQTNGIPDHTLSTTGTYTVLDNSTDGITDLAGVAQPGQTIGILFTLDDNFPTGRDTQFKLSTTNGAVFVGTVVMGQNTG